MPLEWWNPVAVTKLVSTVLLELLSHSGGVPPASYRRWPWADNARINISESIPKTWGWNFPLKHPSGQCIDHYSNSIKQAANAMKLFLSNIVKRGHKTCLSDANPIDNCIKLSSWDCSINLPEVVWYRSSAISCVNRFPLLYLHYWVNVMFLFNSCCP